MPAITEINLLLEGGLNIFRLQTRLSHWSDHIHGLLWERVPWSLMINWLISAVIRDTLTCTPCTAGELFLLKSWQEANKGLKRFHLIKYLNMLKYDYLLTQLWEVIKQLIISNEMKKTVVLECNLKCSVIILVLISHVTCYRNTITTSDMTFSTWLAFLPQSVESGSVLPDQRH